jgi:tetratricopeptide (TPR) repeat protein
MNDEIAMLREKLSHTRDKRERVELLNELSGIVRHHDPADARVLAVEALALATELDDTRGVAISMLRIGNYYRGIGDYGAAKRYLEKSAAMLNEFPDRIEARMEVHRDLGLLYIVHGGAEAALESLDRALSLASETGRPDNRTMILAYKGMFHVGMGQYSVGIEMQHEALASARRCGNRNHESVILQNIATIYLGLHDHQTGLRYLNEGLEIFSGLDMPVRKALLLDQIGTAHRLSGATDEALRYHHMAYEIAHDFDAKNAEATALYNIGACHGDRREYRTANEFFARSLEIADGANLGQKRCQGLAGLGETHFHLGETESAAQYLAAALDLTDGPHLAETKCACCKYLAEIFEARGDMKSALSHHKQWAETKLVLEGGERFKAVALLELRIEMASAEREREQLRLKNEQLQQEMERKSMELTTAALQIVQNNEFIAHLKREIRESAKDHGDNAQLATILVRKLENNAHTSNSMHAFEQQFQHVHHGFVAALSSRYPTLTPSELKICSLLKIGLSNKEMGSLLSISDRTVDTHRASIRRKLALGGRANLMAFLMAL